MGESGHGRPSPNDCRRRRQRVRRLLRARDWSARRSAHPDTWPPELATAVSMALSSAFPMFVAWGPDLCFLYNDAYAPSWATSIRAPSAEPFQQVWAEVWTDLVPIVDRALSNKSAFFEDLPLTLERQGYPEQAYFTFSYSPLHDGQGRWPACTAPASKPPPGSRPNAAPPSN
jgi:hypothetical protein